MVEMHEYLAQILNQYLPRSKVSKWMDPLSRPSYQGVLGCLKSLISLSELRCMPY